MNKSTGTLSMFTCLLNLLGSAARILTTIVEVGDKVMLANVAIAVIINAVILGQILYYWKGKTVKKE